MKTLAQIQQQLAAGRFDFSRHAFKRAVERNITEQEVRTAGARGEIIEGYPEQVFAERLVTGLYIRRTPLHIQVSAADSDLTRIITLYEPDPTKWAELRKRR